MKPHRRLRNLTPVLLLALLNSGCIVVFNGPNRFSDPRVWSEATEELTLTQDFSALEVRTKNGSIGYTARSESSGAATILVRKKAGGDSVEDAEAAMAALEIICEPTSDGTHHLGWRWKEPQQTRWRADVSFDVTGPAETDFDARTYNGSVRAAGIVGNVRVVTHNGQIQVDSTQSELYAETHNGSVGVAYAGPSLTIVTHNGRINADISRCASVRGALSTQNGGVDVSVGSETAADVLAETQNGSIRAGSGVAVRSESRNRLEGQIGAGGQRLQLTTHNGNIRIQDAG